MNCLLQKAVKDRVLNNKCNMDSILWFPLECPQHHALFDEPDTFKLKFRDMFAHKKLDLEVLEEPKHLERLRLEYDMNVDPDDIRFRTEVGDFMQEYRNLNPGRRSNEEDGNNVPFDSSINDMPKEPYIDYAEERPPPPLSTADSARFGTAPMYAPKQ